MFLKNILLILLVAKKFLPQVILLARMQQIYYIARIQKELNFTTMHMRAEMRGTPTLSQLTTRHI